LRAERGFLFLTREQLAQSAALAEVVERATLDGSVDDGRGLSGAVRERLQLAAGRSAAGHELASGDDCDFRLIEDLFEFGSTEGVVDDPITGRGSALSTFSDRAVIATTLSVRGDRIGVVYLDRPLGLSGFSEMDARALSALAAQVPLVNLVEARVVLVAEVATDLGKFLIAGRAAVGQVGRAGAAMPVSAVLIAVVIVRLQSEGRERARRQQQRAEKLSFHCRCLLVGCRLGGLR
jgi:hypothetical protein